MQAAYLHVLGDLLQNVGVIIAGIVIWLNPTWNICDPLCTLFFSLIVLSTTWPLVRKTLNVLMEGTPPGVDLVLVNDALLDIPGVLDVQDLHAWSLTMGSSALSVHILCEEQREHSILKLAQKVLNDQFGFDHSTIQMNCMDASCCEEEPNIGKRCMSLGGSIGKLTL